LNSIDPTNFENSSERSEKSNESSSSRRKNNASSAWLKQGYYTDSKLSADSGMKPFVSTRDDDELVNLAPAGLFLSYLQTDITQQQEQAKYGGTILRNQTLKLQEKSKNSSFKVELTEFGDATIDVTQNGDSIQLTIELSDKTKMPANLLLFNQIVKKQLDEQFNSNFSIKVR
jgi:hypothetical protein